MIECLVIGAGPSLDRFEHLKKLVESDYNEMIIIPEIIAQKCIKAGIKPGKFKNMYFSILEEGVIMLPFLDTELILKESKNIGFICSSRVHQAVKDFGKKHFKSYTEIDRKVSLLTSNNGLFMISAVIEDFNIKKIVMVGMDHAQNEAAIPNVPKCSAAFKAGFITEFNPHTKEEIYLNPIQAVWKKQFNLYREMYFKHIKFINCTGSGSLYGPGIEWRDFNCHLRQLLKN